MDDLISRKAAIDAVKKHYRLRDNDLLELIAFDIERLPSAQPSIRPLDPCETCIYKGNGWDEDPCDGCTGTESKYKPDNGWISVSERLPDEDLWTGIGKQYSADVLITVHNADDEETIIDYGHTIDGAWYSDTTDCIVPSEWKVIAWMPLPDPYKEEER